MKTSLLLMSLMFLGASCSGLSTQKAPVREVASAPQEFTGILTFAREGADLSPYYITLENTEGVKKEFACYNRPQTKDSAEGLCDKIIMSLYAEDTKNNYIGKTFKATWIVQPIEDDPNTKEIELVTKLVKLR